MAVYIELYVNLTFSFFFRTTESLFEELVEQELLKKADNVKLKDYLGNLWWKKQALLTLV